MLQKTNLRPSGVSYDLSGELDFLFSTLDTGNFVHSYLKKEPPFIHTSVDYLMAINNTMSFLISPQHQTTLSGDILCSVPNGRADENLTCISVAYLHILCASILMLNIRWHFPLVVPTVETHFCLKQRQRYIEMILCLNSQPPKQKHMKGIKSFWIFFHLHISFIQSNTPSCLNLLCDCLTKI